MGILNWPDYLRAAGIKVAEHNNWRSNRPLGNLPDRPYLVWHHDASPVGASPGALDWIINAYNAQDASAQIWVGYDGTWHFIGSGIAWHTGAVLSGMPNNYNAVGVETDETTGETWSVALLDALRRGTAAIAAAEGYDPGSWLHFHKTICSPPGRKSDPSGLDLGAERATVRALMSGKNPVQPKSGPADPSVPGGADPKPKEWDEMASKDEIQAVVRAEVDSAVARILGAVKSASEDVYRGTVSILRAEEFKLDAERRGQDTFRDCVNAVRGVLAENAAPKA